MGHPSKYPEEFRRQAVALCRSSDRSRAEVANTSRSSTTASATKPASATAPRPRLTLPPEQPESHQPVSKIAGQLQRFCAGATVSARADTFPYRRSHRGAGLTLSPPRAGSLALGADERTLVIGTCNGSRAHAMK